MTKERSFSSVENSSVNVHAGEFISSFTRTFYGRRYKNVTKLQQDGKKGH
jgi:hypothetical protein